MDILQNDLDSLKSEFQSKHISIKWTNNLPQPVLIYADTDRLSQLYRNLLNNSANYTDSNGQLAITVFRKGDKLVLNFSDTEPGVPEQELPKLFDRFYRLESSRSRNHGGAGLGLAICSNIVEAHNGTIHAQASALKGLAIRIELPISS